MTTEAKPSIASLARRYADLKAALDEGYKNLKEIEYQLIAAIRAEYPDEYARWERGVQTVRAEGVQIPLKRDYDADRVQAEFGEEFPDLVVTETKVVKKVDGRKAAALWKDAALARRLEKCLVPQVPRVSVAPAPAGLEAR